LQAIEMLFVLGRRDHEEVRCHGNPGGKQHFTLYRSKKGAEKSRKSVRDDMVDARQSKRQELLKVEPNGGLAE